GGSLGSQGSQQDREPLSGTRSCDALSTRDRDPWAFAGLEFQPQHQSVGSGPRGPCANLAYPANFAERSGTKRLAVGGRWHTASYPFFRDTPDAKPGLS